jgi:CubicO group peptidase (beta-lactamase class C family)
MDRLKHAHVFSILCSLILLAVAAAVVSAAGPPEESPGGRPARGSRAVDFGELEKVIEAEMKETGTPGAAVAVISDGRVVFSKGFGVASVETGGAITSDTLFRLGSTTKMFTGAALVTLFDKGRIKLDEPVGKYAKGLPPKLAQVTAHQLLSNNAGVGDFSAPPPSHDDAALGAMIRSWKDDVMFGEPGKVY